MLTFAPTAWYPHYAATAPAWGLSALEDQQLGGVIMWVPAGVVYVAAALLLVSHWLRAVEQRGRATRIGRDGAAYPRPSATAPDGMPQRPSQ
jgi:cytochrome c oxidase assembly factor CtaG